MYMRSTSVNATDDGHCMVTKTFDYNYVSRLVKNSLVIKNSLTYPGSWIALNVSSTKQQQLQPSTIAASLRGETGLLNGS